MPLLVDKVVIAPPTDEKTAQERLKQCECPDWWLCTRSLRGQRPSPTPF